MQLSVWHRTTRKSWVSPSIMWVPGAHRAGKLSTGTFPNSTISPAHHSKISLVDNTVKKKKKGKTFETPLEIHSPNIWLGINYIQDFVLNIICNLGHKVTGQLTSQIFHLGRVGFIKCPQTTPSSPPQLAADRTCSRGILRMGSIQNR